jgi:hypothetical protein
MIQPVPVPGELASNAPTARKETTDMSG